MSKIIMHSMQNMQSRVSQFEELVFTIMVTSLEFAVSWEEGCSITNEGGKGPVIKAYWLFQSQ